MTDQGTHRAYRVLEDGSREPIAGNGSSSGGGEAWHSPSVQVSEVRNVTMDRRGNLLITEHDYGYIRIVHGSAVQ